MSRMQIINVEWGGEEMMGVEREQGEEGGRVYRSC